MKFDFEWPSRFREEDVWKLWTTGGQTYGRRSLHIKFDFYYQVVSEEKTFENVKQVNPGIKAFLTPGIEFEKKSK